MKSRLEKTIMWNSHQLSHDRLSQLLCVYCESRNPDICIDSEERIFYAKCVCCRKEFSLIQGE